jgi:hypothetical protein
LTIPCNRVNINFDGIERRDERNERIGEERIGRWEDRNSEWVRSRGERYFLTCVGWWDVQTWKEERRKESFGTGWRFHSVLNITFCTGEVPT